jgi:hypothetical protein
MSRHHRTAAIMASVAAAVFAVALTAPAFAQTAPNLDGVWLLEGDHSAIRTVDGKLPPFAPAAARKYQAAIAARKAGKPDGDTVAACLPHGLPRLMFAAYPVEILQEKTQVTFVHEAQHMQRFVYIGDAMPPLDDLDQNYMGFSAGRWDGDTLVVDSAGFNDKTTIDAAGMPHSVEMKLNERLHLIDGGQALEDVITVNDPKTFTKPWSTRVVLKKTKGARIGQYVCTETNPEGVKR